MNVTLVTAFLRQRLTSPIRVGLLLLVTVFPLGFVAITGELGTLDGLAGPIALILAAGAIGQDVSSGTLQLLLVRPVSRPSYLASRWLAATLGATAIAATAIGLGVIVLLLRGHGPEPLEPVRMLLEALSAAAGQAAVMVMLSTLANGLGDVGLYVASTVLIQMSLAIGTFEHWTWLVRACEELQGVLGAKLSWAWLSHGTSPSWFGLVSWASTLTLALAVGIARLNRRELSYAAG